MPRYTLSAKLSICIALSICYCLPSLAQEPMTPPQLQFLEGHTAPVYAVATSPDGTTMLSASTDGTIRAWDRATNEPIRLLAKDLPGVVSLAVAPNGLHFAAGGLDQQVRIYDLPSNFPRAIVPSMPNTGGRIDVLADGSAALTGDISRGVRLWNLATNLPLRDFAGSTHEITSVLIVSAFEQPPAPPAEKTPAAEGDANAEPAEEKPVELPPPVLKPKFVLAAAKDGTVRVWDIESAQAIGVINTLQQNSLATSSTGDIVVGAGEDGLLRSFRWPLTAPVSLPGFADQVTSVAISADSELLLAGSLDKKVNLFKAQDGTLVHALAGQPGKTTSVAINADSSLVAGGSDLGTIKFWAVEDAADRLALAGHTGAINRLAFPAKGGQVASAGFDGTVRIWNPPVAPRAVPGHTTAVTVVAATTDGNTALSAGADKMVRLWNVKSGEELRAMKDLPQPIVSAMFSKDGEQLALGDAAGTITLQKTKNGADLGSILAHQGPVTGVALSADGTQMVSSGADGTVKRWSLPIVAPQTFKEQEQPITGLAVSTDGKFIVSATSGGDLQMVDGSSGEPLKKLAGENGPISNLTLSADNKLLAVGTSAGSVKFWNTADGSAAGEVAGHTGAVNGLALHPTEPLLATAGEDTTVRVWQMPSAPKPVAKSEKKINALALSTDGTVALLGSADGKAALVKLADGKPVAALADSETAVVSAAFKKDNTSLATGDEAGAIRLFSPADGSPQGVIYGHKGPVTGIDFNPVPAQPLLLTSGADGTVKLWQLPLTPDAPLPVSQSEVSTIAASADGLLTLVASADQSVRLFNAAGSQAVLLEKLPTNVTAAGFTADGKQMLLALASGQVQIRNTTDGALLATVAGQAGGVTGLAVNSKAPQFATAGKNGKVRIWQVPPEIKPIGNHTGAITAIELSPNGQLVATAAADKSVRIWKIADGAEMWTLGHTNPVTSLAWKADSTQLATVDGKSVRLWNIADGAQAATFEAHGADLTGVAFSADSTSLITAGKDKLLKAWKIAPATDEEKMPVVLEGHAGAITSLASVGPTLATGDQSGSVRTWNVAEAKPAIEIKHGEPVLGLAVSADQKLIAAGGKGKEVKLYNVADGKPGPVLAGLNGPVAKVTFSGDNKRVAATSAEGEVRVWSVAGELLDVLTLGDAQATVLDYAPDHLALLVGGSDNKIRSLPPSLVKELTIGETSVNALAYTPDGASLLTGSKDKTVKLWTIADGKAVRDFAGSSAALTAVAVSLDATKVIAADQGKAVRCWNLADAKLLTTLTHPAVVKNLSVSADNLKLATGADDGQVRIWQLPEGRLLQRFATHEKGVTGLAFLPDNKTIVSGGVDQKVIKSTLAATLLLAAHEGGVFDVAFLANGTQFLSGGADKLVKMFDLAGTAVRQFAGAEGAIRSLNLRPDNLQLAAGSDDKHVHFWTVANAAVERKVVTPAAISSVSYTADGTRLAAAGGDGKLRVLQTADGLILEDQALEAMPTAVAFLPDGKTLLVGDESGATAIRTMSLVRVLLGHTAAVQGVEFTPVGTYLLSASLDKQLKYWNLADGALVRSMAHPAEVTGVAVSADGSFAWTSCVDKSLRQWTLGNGQATWTMATDQPLRSLVVSRDKSRATVSADDKTVRVFDLAIQRELQRFAGHAAVPSRLAMTEDNKTLLSAGGTDKSVRKMSIAADQVIVADVGKVNAVALLPDGSQILSAGDDHLTKLWDLEGKLVRQFGGNPTAVRTMAVSPDGKQVALGGDPATAQVNLYLFNIADAALQFTIPTPAGIQHVAYSPDGKVAVSEADSHVRVYDSTTGKLLQDITQPALSYGLAFADDKTLISASSDKNAYVLEYSLAKLLAAHEGSVTGLAYTPDAEHVATSGVDKTVKLWNLSDGTVASTFNTAGIAVNDLALSGDGKILAAASADNKVRVWNVPEKASAAAVPAVQTLDHPAIVMSVGLNKDGSRLVVGCNDASVYVWDTKLKKLLERMTGNTTVINSVKISGDGSMVLSGGVDKTAWRWMTGVKSAAIASEGPLNSVACATDGSQVFTAGADGLVKSWQSADLSAGAEFKGIAAGATFVSADPSGKYLAAAGADGMVQLWEVEGAKAVANLKTPAPAVDIALGDAAQKIVVAGNDNIARCYALAEVEGKPALEFIQQVLGATLPVTEVALAADDHTLVAVSDDRNIRRYHIASGSPLKEFQAHEGEVYGLAYNADGTQLATAGGDHTVAVWDLLEDKLITRGTGHTGQVQGVAFNPDGKSVASAALDGTVRLWSLEANLPGDRPALPKQKPSAADDSLLVRSPLTPLRPRESGLIAEQYANDNRKGEPEVSIVDQINFDWKEEHPESFSVRYSGYLTAPFEGEVTFTAEADDGLRMNVAGTMVIDGPAPDGPREGKLMMVAGESVPFRLDYVQKAEMAKLKLYWSWEGQEKQLIPAEAFQHQPIYVGDEIAQLTAEGVGGLMAVQYSADGNSLLAGGTGKKWCLWSTKDGSLVREGLGHNQTIYGLTFNAANTRIASIDYSGNLFIWNAADAAPLFHQQLPAWAGYGVSYFPDGTEVIAGTHDPRVMRVVIPVPAR